MNPASKPLQDRASQPPGLGDRLAEAQRENERLSRELSAFKQSARAVLTLKSFPESAQAIFDHCCRVIGATSGYVALLNDAGDENEVLFLEAGGLTCSVDPALPMPIRGLRSEAYHRCKPALDNDFMSSRWADFMPRGHVALNNVLFAPLVIDGKAVGLLGLANKKGGFSQDDARIARSFGELAAIALKNSRNIDARDRAQKDRETMIEELRQALGRVRTLSGLLPICAWCKKICDDQGYWQQVERYIEVHSDAGFSHSVCPDCFEQMKAAEEERRHGPR